MVIFPLWDDGSNTPEDAFICKSCHADGKLPFVDKVDSDDESFVDENWTKADEHEHRLVEAHQGLFVGQKMRGGTVTEIYPGLDKFTVAKQTSTGCSIEHLSITTYTETRHE
jgi:hypothetical protein